LTLGDNSKVIGGSIACAVTHFKSISAFKLIIQSGGIMKATRIMFFFGIAAVASATSVTFSFDTTTINGTVITGISDTATPTQIQNYMNSVLSAAGCTGCTVSISSGTYADQTWNADGHTTGPGVSSASTSLTLGNSNGATASNTNSVLGAADTFLANTSDTGAQTASQITMKFSGFTINGAASFDYEIFPNIQCPALTTSSCGGTGMPNQPDFKFEAGTNSNGTDAAVTSFGTNGTQLAITPGTGNDGNTNNSPLSTSELAPQYIGTWSGTLSNVNELDFVDWPATVGVDNLSVSWTTTGQSPVPDPSSVLLLGTLVAGIALRKRMRKTT
jgi:hypothetical protein